MFDDVAVYIPDIRQALETIVLVIGNLLFGIRSACHPDQCCLTSFPHGIRAHSVCKNQKAHLRTGKEYCRMFCSNPTHRSGLFWFAGRGIAQYFALPFVCKLVR